MWSFGVELALLVLTFAFIELWLMAWFVVVGLWPVIWFACGMWNYRGPPGDPLKMQTYYNIDAIRQNTNRISNDQSKNI